MTSSVLCLKKKNAASGGTKKKPEEFSWRGAAAASRGTRQNAAHGQKVKQTEDGQVQPHGGHEGVNIFRTGGLVAQKKAQRQGDAGHVDELPARAHRAGEA